jgi:uncharacterized protein with NRDE domain
MRLPGNCSRAETMCLALIALHMHPRYPLVVAANRDEFHARAADPAYWWTQTMLAGRDRVGGGTWFGVTRAGRWALITNYREGVARDPSAPSRGGLVTQALVADAAAMAVAARTSVDGQRFLGFNLLVGDGAAAAYASNRASGAQALARGVFALSNHLLDTPWPKVVRSKAALATALAGHDDPLDALFELLADRSEPDAATLPATGVSGQWERILSPTFIVSPQYGTRCSTVMTLDHSGAARLVERSFDAAGTITGEVSHLFSTGRELASAQT